MTDVSKKGDWDFTTREEDGPLPLRDAVFQALGGASACWENLEGAGVFESDRCAQIGETLMAYLTDEGYVSAQEQIGLLSKFILDNVPGEPAESEGAIDTAIRLLRQAYVAP